MKKQKILIITGPTASGKSSLAVECAKALNGEIISADSMQIYKGLDIGTAKISAEEMQGIPHYLIDIRSFREGYNAYEFVQDATELIREISSRGKLPIICGGTGLYIKALTENFAFKGSEQAKENKEFDFTIYSIDIARQSLYERINKRVDTMINRGIFEEVEKLMQKGLKIEQQAGKSIGYKEIIEYYNGEKSREEAIDKFKQHSRNYAKRQITFIKTISNVIHLSPIPPATQVSPSQILGHFKS